MRDLLGITNGGCVYVAYINMSEVKPVLHW